VILLDQAASAMDEASLQEISRKFRDLAREVTVIVATLRLPAVLAADRIYAMNGHTVEVDADKLRETYEEEGIFGVTRVLEESAGSRCTMIRAGADSRSRNDDYEDEDDDD
jgi:ABC-type transport system involved in cytochrome bd biosynthesis fused ATPase/permease subunit